MATYYISPTGLNTNDGLTGQTPLLNLDNAVTKAANGDSICFLPGTHLMPYVTVVASFHGAPIFDKNKALTIYSLDPYNTILDSSGYTSAVRDGNCIMAQNSATIIRNLNIVYQPHKPSYNYSNAVFNLCAGKVMNCNFRIIGTNAYKSYTYQQNAAFIFQNNNFNFADPAPIADYTATAHKNINNILPKLPSAGTSAYYLLRQALDSDLTSVASDAKNLGDPTILNSDGSRSHKGVWGGIYGDNWVSTNQLWISGEDTSIPPGTTIPIITYSVNDGYPNTTLNITETINGTTTRLIANAQRDPYTYTAVITQDTWWRLQGSATLTITVDNGGFSLTRTIEFGRLVNGLDIQTIPPRQTTNMARSVKLTLQGQYNKADVSIEVANNGLDDSPTWENLPDIDNEYTFANQSKTADNWAITARIRINGNSRAALTSVIFESKIIV